MAFFTLPHLQHFTIGPGCELNLARMKDENAPRLEALALRRSTKLDGWTPGLASTSPWNLDLLNLDWRDSYHWNDPLPNVLVNVDLALVPSLVSSGAQHVRIVKDSVYKRHQHHGNTSRVLKLILEKSVPLETLILPNNFKPSGPSTSTNNYLRRFILECQQRGIDLIYEESPNRGLDSDVSKAFLKKMKRLKLARQEDQQTEEEEKEEGDSKE